MDEARTGDAQSGTTLGGVGSTTPDTVERTNAPPTSTTQPPALPVATTAPSTPSTSRPHPPAPTPAPPAAPPLPPFTSTIAPVTAAQLASSWREGCPVGPAQLRLLSVNHVDFSGAARTGAVVVHADHAEALRGVFEQLYAARYPIASMVPVEAFDGDDDASMAANNSSAFNCRAVGGTTTWSQHAYGTALDLNPVQNPYVRGSTVQPDAGRGHLERTPAPGRILAGDVVVDAFASIGWSWGGTWSSSKDYQHFSANGR
jgi:hypothetical protein